MIKKIILKSLCVFVAMCAVVSFSGCSLYIASLDKLLRAPMSDPMLEKTINKKLGSSAALVAPTLSDDEADSEYLSSTLNYADLDSDGRDEVICFYSEKSSPENIHVLILKSDGEKWNIVSDTQGAGSEISSLRVIELSDRANKQIVTTWKYVDNKILNISCLENDSQDGLKLVSLCEDRRYDEIEMVDIDSDEYPEMLLINYDTATLNDDKISFLTVLDMDPSGSVVTSGKADMPEECSEINLNFSNAFAETPFVVFLDYKDMQNVTHSSVYFWDINAVKINCISDGTTVTKLNSSQERYQSFFNTARISPSKCVDINNDGNLEIPMAQLLTDSQKGENRLAYTQWSRIVFSKDGTCAFSEAGSEKRIYFDDTDYFKIPAYFDDSKFFAFGFENRKWSFIYGEFETAQEAENNENSCFAVVEVIDESSVDSYENSGYAVLGTFSDESGKVLVYKITAYGTAMGLKRDEIFNIK
ncbi:MAG: hypothetical protein IJS17_03150 [Clostridia bacterium]|nr:hypothetical protein [Clostridia bacterium]